MPIKLKGISNDSTKEMMEHGFAASYTKVTNIITDDTSLDKNQDIKILHTPGHTIGHIVLYIPTKKILIAGDLLATVNDQLMLGKEEYMQDINLAKASLKKLLSYEINTVICYHGGIYQGDVKQAIEKICK